MPLIKLVFSRQFQAADFVPRTSFSKFDHFHGEFLIWKFKCLGCQVSTTTLRQNSKLRETNIAALWPLLLPHDFEPVAIETLDGIGSSSSRFLRLFVNLVQERTGDKFPTFSATFSRFRQRLAVAVQAGNATCVLESLSRFFQTFISFSLVSTLLLFYGFYWCVFHG